MQKGGRAFGRKVKRRIWNAVVDRWISISELLLQLDALVSSPRDLVLFSAPPSNKRGKRLRIEREESFRHLSKSVSKLDFVLADSFEIILVKRMNLRGQGRSKNNKMCISFFFTIIPWIEWIFTSRLTIELSVNY